jgi:hypothetical protein
MATLFDRSRGAIDEPLGENTDTDPAVAMEDNIVVAKSARVGGTAAASGGDDPTESLLGALEWGLRQYGLDIYNGCHFLRAFARRGSFIPSTISYLE